MTYEPREGVDYIVDLYAIADVSREAADEAIKTALNERLMQYHPDRLEGLAPEFREKGERMGRLLNRARGILLDADRRAEYDQILEEWTGPVSADGIPVMTAEAYLQAEMASRTPEEVEAIFGAQRAQAEAMTGYSPSRLKFVEEMIDQAGHDVPEGLRSEYEAALLAYDRVLAIEESERGGLLGIGARQRFEASFGYADSVAGEVGAAREAKQAQLRALAAGSFGTRLALLAGDEVPQKGTSVVAASRDMSLYFDQQAAKVQKLAEEREAILLRRLGNFEPTYPGPELQTEARETFAVGVMIEGKTNWQVLRYNAEQNSADVVEADDDLLSMLDEEDFAGVIQRGFSVFMFEPLEQIELETLLRQAIEKHISRLPGY